MKLDRTLIPEKSGIENINFSFPEKISLDNQTPLHYYHEPNSEVVKIEWIFPAGSWFGNKNLQSSLTNTLITSGTSKWSQKEIAEKIDFYGAYFEKTQNKDHGMLTVFSLRKYAIEVLKIINEVLNDCVFPQDEMLKTLNIRKQKFLINSEKVSSLARREFNPLIFGAEHPYGKKVQLSDYDNIKRNDLISFYNRFYKQQPTILAAGNVDKKLISEINKLFGSGPVLSTQRRKEFKDVHVDVTSRLIEKKDAVQSAIRMGRKMFNRTHEDFSEMQVLITLFGGYFGSRLMSNLREDKGYTYGIGAGLNSMLNGGVFFISTEVGAAATSEAKKEIFVEMKILRDNPVSAHELDTVKNYMLGRILRSTDGVFSSIDRFKGLHMFGQNVDHFTDMVQRIRDVQPARLQELANQWLDAGDMTVVVTGAK